MKILLIAGMWLDGSAWGPVVPELVSLGHDPVALHLPGQGDGSTTATLDDQIAAVLATVDAAESEVVIVGHSAACTLAWLAADARPDKVSTVVLIGGFPGGDGTAYADFFEPVDGLMAFPGWEPFEGPDSADLDQAARDQMAATTIAVPASITKATVHYRDERRFDVPVVLICPEFSPADAREWIAAGDVPELAKATRLAFADIDSGHWPMVTKPIELARLISEAAHAM